MPFDLAEAYLRRGDREAARQQLGAVLRLDPSHRAARRLLAKIDRSAENAADHRTSTDRETIRRSLALGERGGREKE